MFKDIEAGRGLLYRACLTANPFPDSFMAAAAKIFCNEMSLRVTTEAVQVHGAIRGSWLAVRRLSRSWDSVGARYKRLFEELKALTSPSNNYEAYRNRLRSTSDTMLPSLHVYLHDLLAVHALHDFLRRFCRHEKAEPRVERIAGYARFSDGRRVAEAREALRRGAPEKLELPVLDVRQQRVGRADPHLDLSFIHI